MMEHFLIQLLGLEGIQFAQADWLWGIVIWPVLWATNALLQARGRTVVDDLVQLQAQRQLVVKHALIHKMADQPLATARKTWTFSGKKFVLNLVRGLMVSFLCIALAQPQKEQPLEPLPQQKTVRDVVFVIESSASFLLPDYQVNGQSETRMNVVKAVLDRFIADLEGNRFGIAIYAEQAYTLMPLTSDQTAARLTLKRLKPYLAGRVDYAMGEALGLALKQTDLGIQAAQLKQASVKGKQQAGTSDHQALKRVVVLISDGLSKPSRLPLADAVNYAQLMNVPIYTIGVGAGSADADKRLYTGLLYQPLESDSLKAIAKATQAQYFEVGSGQDLNRVLQQINAAEGVPFESDQRPPQHIPLMHIPLQAAVITLFIYLLLSLLLSGGLGSINTSRTLSKVNQSTEGTS
ncbi:MAG: VWA domain-containing protein [Gammaproteobacteria bacterium]|nr:VWA domain-containing protein [Gammaproteobacteria bacterium]